MGFFGNIAALVSMRHHHNGALIEADCVESVLNHPGVIEWVAAGKLETEVIEGEEIEPETHSGRVVLHSIRSE